MCINEKDRNFAPERRRKGDEMKRFFTMKTDERSCTIYLYGDIGENYEVRSGIVARELAEAEAKYERINVRINSHGGDVYSGIAIFNALKNSSADIHIYIDGIAASMASVIALCGKPVEMSKYARLMLHSVSGGCYGNKKEMQECIHEIEALEDSLSQMYSQRLGMSKEDVKAKYFDNADHWINAEEALALGFIDGIYDADPIPADSTPEQIYTIFNNRLDKPQNENQMNLEELKKNPRFNDCTTEADVMKRIGELEGEAAKVPGLEADKTRLEGEVKVFRDKAETDAANARKSLLDAAEADGRIDATTRSIYENMLKEHPEDGKKALEALAPKRKVMHDLHITTDKEGPWEKRMREIRENKNRN